MADNWLDRAINWVSPSAGARRAKARFTKERFTAGSELARKYDAADKGRRTDGWTRGSTSANAETYSAIMPVRDAARDLVRNNPHANKGLGVVGTSIVGTGIRPEFSLPDTVNNADEITARYTAAWRMWANSTECSDDGRHNLAGIQRLAARALVQDGEVLIRRRVRRPGDGVAIPLQLQVLEADYIDTSKEGTNGGNVTIQGIEFDQLGNRAAYWLFTSHPGNNGIGTGRLGFGESRRVEASEIIHLYRMDRPGQVRGVSWMAPVIIRLKDIDDANDAYLWRQKIAACFTAFVYDANGESSTAGKGDPIVDSMEPGIIETLPPGKDIKFAEPPGVEGFTEFDKRQLMGVAAGLGITYESLTGDLGTVNFLSGRLGKLDMQKNVDEWQRMIFIPSLMQPIYDWFKNIVDLTGLVNPADVLVEWITPPRDMLDPEKEFKTLVSKVRNGMPLYDMLQHLGYTDPEAALKRKQKEAETLDELALVLDNDPRKMSASGNPVNAGTFEEPDGGNDSETDD